MCSESCFVEASSCGSKATHAQLVVRFVHLLPQISCLIGAVKFCSACSGIQASLASRRSCGHGNLRRLNESSRSRPKVMAETHITIIGWIEATAAFFITLTNAKSTFRLCNVVIGLKLGNFLVSCGV